MFIENSHDAQFNHGITPSPKPANCFKRWLANVINTILFWVAISISFRFGNTMGVIGALLYLGIQAYFMKTYGQTIAKRWLSLVVLDFTTKQPISFGKYIGREIIDLLFASTSILILVSGVVALVRDDSRSLTDLIIGSIVVKEE